ncbi:MAG: 4-hydroxybenzoate octaprenyltransferase [Bacteroidetes bacterium GWE2_41_25]|nr:MAG: 4-hydroxybenzoate octaprenyltransferase [Bacteroidetes bacterium GWA2_40_15]OFX91945.1 MAG: 4-hydroxybenzoate octaprenyltransferase [Bacteroidetes bacterium GWE2_41_25]OFX95654.1 MAG: 4-hydroxybenzoate octaprenyltransferase [Bacteroidetes bacterium GWC2_40_22]OFY58100.1 MAG: 4-hydroxybenzoate octaprenyltransferase [Bacteroidetes bacterium GWF2_41_9]HAM08933.1 4-hydroxybenzoate octaprenyltransferase [Bacteroidales bacterium]
MKLFRPIRKYFSLVKFSHTVFAMPFALIGFSLGISDGDLRFSLKLLLLIILCMVFARNSAMGFNRLVDRKFDEKNPRTKNREIPSGIISPGAATLFIIINAALFIATTYFINRLVFWLSPVALLVILGYSLTKRITALCHLILGLGLSLAPIGAYLSVTGSFNLLPVIYSFIVFTWSGGFDIIYALQDDDFDRSANLYSIPSLIGRKNALIVSSILHSVTFMLVITAGITGGSGYIFWAGALIFSILLLYQHLIVKYDDLSKVNLAFGTTNGIASIIFALFVIIDLF